MRLVTIFGTRPEIIRLSLLFKKLDEMGVENVLVHTGQNYDASLSGVFFKELGVPKPDHFLGVKSPTAGAQIARIIERSEKLLVKERPDALLILGDTNSGLSALAAARLNIPVAHMEAGNRCYDWEVPEEKNRRVIDHLSDWLFPYTRNSRENLLREGIDTTKIIVSGNPIVDILRHWDKDVDASPVLEKLGLRKDGFFVATSHREENVDRPERLTVILEGFKRIVRKTDLPIVWSVHPRTAKRLAGHGRLPAKIRVRQPFGMFDFLKLEKNARCVITDSGTCQEEASLYNVPAVTLRSTTERPETVECGSNMLSGVDDPERILHCVELMSRSSRDWKSPYADDKDVAEKMAQFLVSYKKRR